MPGAGGESCDFHCVQMSLGAGPEHNIPFTPQRSVCKSVLTIMGLVKTCGSQTQAPALQVRLTWHSFTQQHLLSIYYTPEAAQDSEATKRIRHDRLPGLEGDRQTDRQNTLQVHGLCPSQEESFQGTERKESGENSSSGKTS